MANFMVSTHLQPQFASYEVDEGVKNYSYKTLEGECGAHVRMYSSMHVKTKSFCLLQCTFCMSVRATGLRNELAQRCRCSIAASQLHGNCSVVSPKSFANSIYPLGLTRASNKPTHAYMHALFHSQFHARVRILGLEQKRIEMEDNASF
eukprot:6196427-Pleurochrysis_carterae.AAC.2